MFIHIKTVNVDNETSKKHYKLGLISCLDFRIYVKVRSG